MDDKEFKNNIAEIALACSTYPHGNENVGDEPFQHSDEATLLACGFTYVDTFTMRAILDGITYYVSFHGNYPRWEYMVHGSHRTPRHLGTIKYRHVTDKFRSLSKHLIEKENSYAK
jgi:hypothetical protein